MSYIPAEGTWAGDVFAVMTVVAPVSSLILSAVVPSKLLAFFSAITVSGLIIAFSVWSAGLEQTTSSQLGPAIFASWAGSISIFVAAVVTIGRRIITWPEVTVPSTDENLETISKD